MRKASGGDSRKMHPFAIDIIKIHPFGREMAVKEAVTHKRANVCGPMVFGDGFRVCRADAETGRKCHRRQGRSPRQVADARTIIREMRVFPPLVQQSLRTTEASTLMRVSGESVSGTKRKTLSRRWARSGQLCPPSEDLEDLERNRRNDSDVGAAERLSILERKKRAVLITSALPIPCRRKAFMTD